MKKMLLTGLILAFMSGFALLRGTSGNFARFMMFSFFLKMFYF
ncbi:MAG: hypothetical protein NTW95_04350 [Candidatus Aminicenantes bacterium]|nr:hypothetical protein [Candidatus Aminicenantes bacterium]